MMLDADQCFEHDNKHPVERLRFFGCDGFVENTTIKGTPLCEFSLPNGKHAWYHESTQNIDKSTFPWESAVHKKKTRAECRESYSIIVNLNNGRSCSSNSQCYSKTC